MAAKKSANSSVYDIFNDTEFSSAINNIDKLITTFPTNTNNSEIGISDNLVSQALKDTLNVSSIDKVDELFDSADVSQSRLSRYNTYDQLYNSVQLIKKIIKTYLINILQPDSISNKTLLIKEADNFKDKEIVQDYKQFSNNCINYYNLEQKLRDHIVINKLKYGDSFIEVIDLENIKIDFPKNKLKKETKDATEHSIFETISYQKIITKSNNEYKTLNFDDIYELSDLFLELDDVAEISTREMDIYESEKLNNEIQFSKILLKFHTPHTIIPIVSDYDSVLGYLEIRELTKKVDGSVSAPLAQFVNLVNQISATNSIVGLNKDEKIENTIATFAKVIITKVFDKYKIFYKDDKSYAGDIKNKLEPELLYVLKRLLLTTDKSNLFKTKLKVRFIESENMFHYKMPGGDFFPYGMSVIDPLVYPGKLYLLTQLANAVTKLSRSALIRKWTIETGARKDTSALLNKLKKNLRNQRTTAEDLMSAKSIPNILSDFKDMVTLCAVQY